MQKTVSTLLILLAGALSCVTTDSGTGEKDLEIECYATMVPGLKGYFAIKCYPDNLTEEKVTLQIDRIRFPNFAEEVHILLPEKASGKLTDTNPAGPGLRYVHLPATWHGTSREAVLALFLFQMAHIAGRAGSPPPESMNVKEDYQSQFLLKKQLIILPQHKAQGIILAKSTSEGRIPETIEFSLSQPDLRSLVIPVKVDIRLLRMRPPEVSPEKTMFQD